MENLNIKDVEMRTVSLGGGFFGKIKISVEELKEILRVVEEECKKLNIKIITQDDRDITFKVQRPLQYIAYDCKENICKRLEGLSGSC